MCVHLAKVCTNPQFRLHWFKSERTIFLKHEKQFYYEGKTKNNETYVPLTNHLPLKHIVSPHIAKQFVQQTNQNDHLWS